MAMPPGAGIRCISDFTCEPLVRLLQARIGGTDVSATPFNQVHQSLHQAALTAHDPLIVWTTPTGVLPSFARAARFEEVNHADVLREVDEHVALVAGAALQGPVLVATWTHGTTRAGYGLLDWTPGVGLAGLLARMNLRLAEGLADVTDAYVLDAQRWLHASIPPESPRLWFAAKVPFTPEVFAAAASDVTAALDALSGRSRRLVVVDLDNTLWGGVVGDVGWERLRLGGPDPLGEAFEEFQLALRELSTRGIQLAVVSKNTHAVALEAIERHPAMRLGVRDFAAMRINWEDKARNVEVLVAELGLSLSSVVFLDDNPVERGRVREALPQVLVPEWPADPMLYAHALRSLPCFATSVVSHEDRTRTRMYAEQQSRIADREAVQDLADWLKTLETTVTVERISDASFSRVAQLINKTNQLNLQTRRLSEQQLRSWVADPGHDLLVVSVSDRFGELGIVGVIGLAFDGPDATVSDLVLSCRAMGRGIEDALVHVAWTVARQRQIERLHLKFVPTERNQPTLAALRSSALVEGDDFSFAVDAQAPPRAPEGVSITLPEAPVSRSIVDERT